MSVQWDADAVVRRIRQAAADGVFDAASHILEESNRVVPIEEATLLGSGTVTMRTGSAKATSTDTGQVSATGRPAIDTRGPVAVVSYDTPYAVVQHEDTELQHDPGREAKYLQRTINRRGRHVERFIADRIKAAIR